ncbi:MAG: hypothetical protein V4581_17435, partial [Bacteroidota bacterium]
MSEKKNIDRLFQEKFKDFEVAPPDFVWDNIEDILKEKKKRRVIPLWIRLGGVAAVLVAGMFFLYPYFTADTTGNGIVLDGQKQTQPGSNNPLETTPAGKAISPNRNVGGNGPNANTDAIVSGSANDSGNDGLENNSGTKSLKTQRTGSDRNNSNNNAVVHRGSKNNRGHNKNNNQKHALTPQEQNIAALQNNEANKLQSIDKKNNAGITPKNGNPQRETGLAIEDKNNNSGQPASNQTQQQQSANTINRDIPVSPLDGLADITTDTIPKAETELDKLKREQEEQKAEKALAQNDGDGAKWNIKPQMGPLLYSSLSNGSPIDPQFTSNSKSYDNQLSYGVGVDYALTKNLSVRSGINTVNLSYATQGVQFYASLNNQTSNVAKTTSANIVVETQQTQQIPSSPGVGFNSDLLPQEKFNGNMVQSTGYIEVPVEMSYALLNKKFGINVIGGFSTLFLNENNVRVISDQGLSTNVGEAQNLNNIHFSTNLGVGFKYKFFKQFEATFEPTFKYQVNAYSRDAGNFKPY